MKKIKNKKTLFDLKGQSVITGSLVLTGTGSLVLTGDQHLHMK